MLKMQATAVRIIPCLDLKDGRVVKGVGFRNLRDVGDPVELARRYEAQGADELVVLDIAATPREAEHTLEVLGAIRSVLSIPLTAGGGVRRLEDARRLLEAGADKVATNTAAVRRPALIDEMASAFGQQCTVLAIDAARAATGWQVLVRGGRDECGLDAVEWATEGARRGAGELLVTSHDRDGGQAGYDLELLREVRRATPRPLIASGGAGRLSDLVAGADAGATGLLVASLLHDGIHAVEEMKAELRKAGRRTRR